MPLPTSTFLGIRAPGIAMARALRVAVAASAAGVLSLLHCSARRAVACRCRGVRGRNTTVAAGVIVAIVLVELLPEAGEDANVAAASVSLRLSEKMFPLLVLEWLLREKDMRVLPCRLNEKLLLLVRAAVDLQTNGCDLLLLMVTLFLRRRRTPLLCASRTPPSRERLDGTLAKADGFVDRLFDMWTTAEPGCNPHGFDMFIGASLCDKAVRLSADAYPRFRRPLTLGRKPNDDASMAPPRDTP